MEIVDNGPQPNAFDLEEATVANAAYRTVAWTGRYLQVTLMSIPVGESIGLEVHPETDQFLRIDQGSGRCVMGPAKDDLPITHEVSDGWSIQVPAGVWHDVINTADEPLKVYAVYAPVASTRRPPTGRATRRRGPMSRPRGRSSPAERVTG
jgi:mannose-6-phosphate isomerase-like protein (cupin superfamily)